MKNVLPIFEFYVSSMYHLLRGVTDYAKIHDWHLGIISNRFELPRNWNGDGILTHLTDSPQLKEFLQVHADVPIISFNKYWGAKCNFPYAVVCEDNEEIGRIAARYFLSLGDMNYCWYGNHPLRYSGFVDELTLNNRRTQTIIPSEKILNHAWNEISGWLLEQLRKLQLPCAVFCDNDSWARELLEAALMGGFRVPEDIAILGVDNEELICNSVSIPISSIDNRLRKIGYEGAALLGRLMGGEPFPADPVLVPPVPLPVVRSSSDVHASGNPVVAKAVEFIRKNHTSDISVLDIARKAGISDSGLRKLMNRTIGTSPCQLLLNSRIAAACRLLRETELKIEDVAIHSGFGSAQSLHEHFRHVLDTTPQRFRHDSRI